MEPQRTFTPYGAPIRDAKLLPVQPPSKVIGRNRELGSMHVTLKVGSSIFLSGPAGIGKTALAAVLATALVSSNPGGVLWFNILEDDLEMLVARVGRAYGVNALAVAGEDPASSTQIIRALLEKNRPLIVLDGLIDLDAVRDFVRQCAAKIPTIVISEESASGPWTPLDLGPLTDADSLALFKHYSGLADPAFDADIQGLCKFLGGNPLAIELAARQVSTDDQTPAELLTALPSSTGQDSQLMMMSVIFKKLAPPTQAMLLVLAAMFTGEASAELISDVSNVPANSIVPLMRQLVNRGIAHESVKYGQYAYTLHESAQAYTRGWLQQYQRLQPTENRALQAVVKYVERHAQKTAPEHDRLAAEIENIIGAAAFATATSQEAALRQLIQAVVQKAGDFVTIRGFQPEVNQMKKLSTLLVLPDAVPVPPAATAASAPSSTPPTELTAEQTVPTPIPVAPSRPTIIEPPVDSGATPVIRRLPQLAKPTDSAADPNKDIRATQPTPAVPSIEDTQATTPAMDTQLMPAVVSPGEATPITERMEPAISEFATIQSAAVEGKTVEVAPAPAPVDSVVDVAVALEEPPKSPEDTDIPTEASLPTIERRLTDARESGDLLEQAKLLQTLAQFHADQGEIPQALEAYKQALNTYESIDDKDGMLAVLDALATITSQADDAEGALVYATRGVNLAQQTGERPRLGRLQIRLGDVRLALGDLPAAIETYAQAAETLRGTEDWMTIGLVMAKLGNAYLEQKKPQEASMMLEQALVIFRREQRPDYEGRVLGSMGNAYGELKQWPKAQQYHEQALTLAHQHDDQVGEAAELSALAYIREIQGDLPAAIQHYRQALHVAYQARDEDLQAQFAFSLGSLLLDDTRTLIQAAQLLRESDSLVANSEAKRLLVRANKRLERTRAAGINLPAAQGSNQDYAAAAYNNTIGSALVQ